MHEDQAGAERALRIDGLANGRDLGGLPIIGGGRTPAGVFLRSERPDLLDDDGWAALGALGVRTVVDLRQQVERDADRRTPPGSVVVRHVDHDGLEHAAFWADYWQNGLVGTPLYYLPHLAAMPERTVAVLHALATAPEGGVLFHCAGGRDRTGLFAAILLLVAGVEREAIVADYLQSVRNAERLSVLQGRENPEPEVDAVLAEHGTTSEEAFRTALGGLDVEAVLAALPEPEARALRTWRGTLPAQRP
jgi:hypothetical protein